MPDRNVRSLAWLLVGTIFAFAASDLWANIPVHSLAIVASSVRMQVFLAFSLVAAVVWVWGWLAIRSDRKFIPPLINKWISLIFRLPVTYRKLLAFLVVLFAALGVYFMLDIIAVGGLGLSLFVLVAASLAAGGLWSFGAKDAARVHALFGSLVFTFAFSIALSRLLSASPYPFSLGWSEGNRLWDYSLMFGSDRYIFPQGERIFGYISPGRSIVWGLPFIFPSSGIFAVRLWSQLVNIVPYTVFAFLLLDRSKTNPGERWLFAAWGFLFLSQGPVYPHLLVAAIIVLIGVRSRSLFFASAMVAVSAYFAYYSRWSWVYAPGLWAGMLALMSAVQPSLHRRDWPKLVRPLVLGIAGFIGGQWLPMILRLPSGVHPATSGNLGVLNVSETVTYKQVLLWDRLWPNATFGPGIIVGLLMTVVPLMVWLLLARAHNSSRLNSLQRWGIAFPIIAFLVVGVIASTKIGGGGDLHNMDMFFVAMLIMAAYFWPQLQDSLKTSQDLGTHHFLVYLLLLAPLLYTLRFSYSPPIDLPAQAKMTHTLHELQAQVEQAKAQGEVLFMDQRQLLTFGFIQDVPLVDLYEKKVVIDMAMSADQRYFDAFYRDLADHRFSLIVTEPINLRMSGGEGPFAEENDIWVEWVSTYLLRYYKVAVTFKPFGIQLLVPR